MGQRGKKHPFLNSAKILSMCPHKKRPLGPSEKERCIRFIGVFYAGRRGRRGGGTIRGKGATGRISRSAPRCRQSREGSFGAKDAVIYFPKVE